MLQTFVRDFPYIHLAIGAAGNAAFLVGSVLFFKFFEAWHTFAIWLFVFGSAAMLIGSLGQIARTVFEARERRADRKRATHAQRRMAS